MVDVLSQLLHIQTLAFQTNRWVGLNSTESHGLAPFDSMLPWVPSRDRPWIPSTEIFDKKNIPPERFNMTS